MIVSSRTPATRIQEATREAAVHPAVAEARMRFALFFATGFSLAWLWFGYLPSRSINILLPANPAYYEIIKPAGKP